MNAIVEAVLRELRLTHGLGRAGSSTTATGEGAGKTTTTTLVFGGASAGARGAMVHLDYLNEYFPMEEGTENVTVLGLLDSPLWLDLDPYHTGRKSAPGLAYETQAVLSLTRAQHLDPACAAQNRGDEWRCLFGQYRMQFVKTPYLLIASQYDSYQLNYNLGGPPHSGKQLHYAEDFAKETVSLLQSLEDGEHRVFSHACFNHAGR